MNRRQFLIRSSQTVLGGLVISALPSWANALSAPVPQSVDGFSPIASFDGSFSSTDFNGDRIDRPHDILWDIEGFLRKMGGEPNSTADFDVVVVGGGIAGLTAAYELRDKRVLIIDQDLRFGGNSKGEDYNGTRYSIGGAYISKPDEGSDILRVLSDLGLMSKLRPEHGDEVAVFHKGQLANRFWSGTTAPDAAGQFSKINSELIRIYDNEYPEIPLDDSSREQVLKLDKLNFYQWLKSFGEIHPDVEEYFRLYGWSSFGASIEQLSAAQMINFVAAETQTIMALPGGNAAIAEALMNSVKTSGASLEAGALAIKLKVSDDGSVKLCYLSENNKLVSVSAKAALFCAPKFVGSKVISNLPAAQATAMGRIGSRAYVVANVLLNKEIDSPAFDLYNLRGSKVIEPGPLNTGDRFLTDICFGDWANFDNGRSVLTLYMPLPYDGARQFLFKGSAHEQFKQKALNELKQVLPALGLSETNIEGVRLTRWGHALPIARQGLLSEGILETASTPVQGKIFFANQDNWANPSFETAFNTAVTTAAFVRSVLV